MDHIQPMRRRLVLCVIAFALVAAAPAFAGGRTERAATPAAPEPRDASEREDTSQASEVEEPSLLPMDEATAGLVVALGMMPFEQKIPSEDFTLELLGGGESALSEHRGKVVFLNFWATWCPPCREEMPSMQTLYDELADEGLEILAVNVLEDVDTAQAFIDEQGFTYPVLMDTNGRVMLRYGVRAYPTTYIIDRDGNVIGVRPGFHDWGSDGMIASMRMLLEAE
jgi:cytochrome c-type biogenesis protein